MLKAPEAAGIWQLYLVDWGYNTADERAAAAANPGVELIGVEGFAKLMGEGAGVGAEH